MPRKKKETKQQAGNSQHVQKALETINQINKYYGRRVIKTAKDLPPVRKVRTGEPALDYVLGGGVPVSRIIEFLGDEHSGKTRDAYMILKAFQHYCANCYSQDLMCEWGLNEKDEPYIVEASCSCGKPKPVINVIVDYEKTTDLAYIQKYFDIDLNGVEFVVPDTPSALVDVVEALLRNPEIGLVIVDSIGMISSDSEIAKPQSEIKMNEGARFMNMAVRKWQAALNDNFNKSNGQSITTLLLINRTYETLSLYSSQVPQGGRGLRHAKSITIDRRIVERVKNKENRIVSINIEYRNLKNKAGFPYRTAKALLYVDEEEPEKYMQSNVLGQYVDFALRFGLVSIKGGWYEYDGKKWHGRSEFEQEIRKTDLPEKIDKIIYEKS